MGLRTTDKANNVKPFIIIVALPIIAIFITFAQNGSFERAFVIRSVSAELETPDVAFVIGAEEEKEEEDITENRMIIPLRYNYAQRSDSSSNLKTTEDFRAAAATDLNALSEPTALSSCNTQKPTAISASKFLSPNAPANAIDSNPDTRWANKGVGSWITLDLGSNKNICHVYISWFMGDSRKFNFGISVSTDGSSFTTKFTGSSSGSTTANEKYILPPGTEARYVRITVNGNDKTDYAAITEIKIFGSASGDAGTLDKFGIKKIYSSKTNGQQWYLGDPGLITGGVGMEKVSNYYETKSTQVRLRVPPPSSGYHPDQISTLNQNQMASKGYMQSAYDWKNVEITGRFRVMSYTDSTTNGAAHIELSARGGTHTSSAPCEGTAYHGNLYVTGRSKFEKELMHTGGYATNNPQKVGAVGPLLGKWFDFKHAIYTLPSGNVKVEQWYREYVNDQWTSWVKIHESTDTGSWGGGTNNCNGTSNNLISWGGPLVFFRWDNIDKMHFYNLSIREIVPP